MTMSDWEEEDPNRRVPGSYILNTVELVCFCEHYSTNGLLSWFIDYKCFGCYDDDHGSVNLFLGTNWNDILARPNFFIGSQWNGPTKPVVLLTNPWERLKFRKANPPEELVPILKALQTIDRAFDPKALAYLSDLIRHDLDLGTVFFFRGVSWKSLLARADFYIESPWIEPQKPIAVLKNLWERLSFRKSRSASNMRERRSDNEIIIDVLMCRLSEQQWKSLAFESNNHEDGRSWKNSFIPFSPSLRKMMDDWLDREDLWSIAGIHV